MPINQAWYNLQSTRSYPVSDIATAVDDLDKRLADDILVDCLIRFQGNSGDSAYIAGVSVTPRLVTVLIGTSAGNLIAAVNILQPVATGRMYPVEALQNGTGGWLVFGDGVHTTQSYRFSTYQQSRLLARCASSYPAPNVPSLAKADQSSLLSGLVDFKSGSDVTATIEPIYVLGKLKRAVVFRLTADNTNRNALADYNSPCEPRPESRNCNHPGVEYINSVPPDCDGNINIVFTGLVPGAYQHCAGGVTLDYEFGLADVCNVAKSKLRPTHTDYCGSIGSSLFIDEQIATVSSVTIGIENDNGLGCTKTPVCYTFGTHSAAGFTTRSGLFGFANHTRTSPGLCPGTIDAPPSVYTSLATYKRNTATFASCETDMRSLSLSVDMSIPNSTAAKNGHAIIGWRPGSKSERYVAVAIDMADKTLKILKFSGSGFTTVGSTTTLALLFEHWYRVTIHFTAVDAYTGTIIVDLYESTGAHITTYTLHAFDFGAPLINGFCGVGSDSAVCHFQAFKLGPP